MASVRRIVTGVDADGRSTAVVEDVPAVRGVVDWHAVGGWDEPPRLPIPASGGQAPGSLFPPLGGLRAGICVFPPGMGTASAPPVDEAGAAEFMRLFEAVPPGGAYDEATGIHSTETIDIGFVISGEIELELENGSVTLRPGDAVVQNGTVHAWRNHSTEPCVVGSVSVRAGS
jgi:hypothetical protein